MKLSKWILRIIFLPIYIICLILTVISGICIYIALLVEEIVNSERLDS